MHIRFDDNDDVSEHVRKRLSEPRDVSEPVQKWPSEPRTDLYLKALDAVWRGREYPAKGAGKLVGVIKPCCSVLRVIPPEATLDQLSAFLPTWELNRGMLLGRFYKHLQNQRLRRNAAIVIGSREDSACAAGILNSMERTELQALHKLDRVHTLLMTLCVSHQVIDECELAQTLVQWGWIEFANGDAEVGSVALPQGHQPVELLEQQKLLEQLFSSWETNHEHSGKRKRGGGLRLPRSKKGKAHAELVGMRGLEPDGYGYGVHS